MSRTRMVHKEKREHGPVKRITDPGELARLGDRYGAKAKPMEAVPCTGNSITITISVVYERKTRTVTDHDILRLLDADAERPPDQKRLSVKNRNVLVGFRIRLSRQGAASFTESQCHYFGSLIHQAENPRTELPLEVKEQINNQIAAVFAVTKSKDKNAMVRAVLDFFPLELFFSVIFEVEEILRPYGLQSRARPLVIGFGRAEMLGTLDTAFRQNPSNPGKELFKLCLGFQLPPPDSRRLEYCLLKLPEELRKELKGVPPHATEMAKDAIETVIGTGSTQVQEILAGSPGSGKGGDGR